MKTRLPLPAWAGAFSSGTVRQGHLLLQGRHWPCPAHVKAHTYLGSTYAMVAEYELAVECYEEAIRVDPGYEEANAGLGAIRAFLGSGGGEARDLGQPPK